LFRPHGIAKRLISQGVTNNPQGGPIIERGAI